MWEKFPYSVVQGFFLGVGSGLPSEKDYVCECGPCLYEDKCVCLCVYIHTH